MAGDVFDDGVHQAPPATIYWPGRLTGAYQPRRVNVVIRTERAGTQSLLDEVRAAVWSVNRSLPLAQVATQDDVYQQSMSPTSFTLVMLAIAGTMALLLGIAGSMASSRTRSGSAAARSVYASHWVLKPATSAGCSCVEA